MQRVRCGRLFLLGLGLLDSAGPPDPRNPTVTEQEYLIDGQSTRVVCEVRRNGVKVLANDKTVVDWTGDPARLSPHQNLKRSVDRQGHRLGLVQWEGRVHCRKARLHPLKNGN